MALKIKRARTDGSDFAAVRPRRGDSVIQTRSSGRGRRHRFTSRRLLLENPASTTVDADRHVSRDGHASMQARLLAIVVDRNVLGRAVIPNRNVAYRPSPSHRVLEPRHVSLQQREELFRIGLRKIDKVPQERTEHESPFAGSRMNADDGMLGLINCRSEN